MSAYDVGLKFFDANEYAPCNNVQKQLGCQCLARCALLSQPGGYHGGACPAASTASPSARPTFVWSVANSAVRAQRAHTAAHSFHGSTLMQTPNGEKRLDELRYGDEVRVVSMETGATSFEPVDYYVRPPPPAPAD